MEKSQTKKKKKKIVMFQVSLFSQNNQQAHLEHYVLNEMPNIKQVS